MSRHPVRDSSEFKELLERLAVVDDLARAAAVLRWDMETYMPPGGAGSRSQQVGTLRRLSHQHFTDPRTGELLHRLAGVVQDLPYDSFEASLVRRALRDYERATRVPARLVGELGEATALASHAWARARSANDFASFAPYLERNLALLRELADRLGYEQHPYDALLDEYEPGMRLSDIEPLFEKLRDALVPLVQAISRRAGMVDDSLLHQPYDEQRQWQLTLEALKAIGYDFERGRQDRSAHPFTTTLGFGDVRLTTRIDPQDFSSALFSSMHEGGHALYEQGIPEELARTPLGDAASLGTHESQSRLWENVIGRSREFWRFFLPKAQALFPDQLGKADVETIYRAVNRSRPGEVRTEADEVTYNLHIFLRLELEKELLTGRLAVKELPEAWNAKMESYLGIRPRDDAHGVLQDIHWSQGMIGYFPTYALGNVLSVQFFDQARSERPEILEAVAHGEFQPLLSWLRERIHRHGSKFTPKELVERVTGSPIRVEPYLAYLQRKYAELYGL
ncbi:carboxypeptidase M32 [Carboxydochorda subterranea]|uniref:Metal-dependent carboxypeptidase n=1 Tax=Carboxydichorda subterranea TaxID=3109565 RepID=A0ABZ1BXX7_9FIRM|nr:carboxypeptidase M32 [Limnochorda sp. L945t]WRP17652.1 carboxypeptidase M32 [Limnochorda sp. L945t]